MVYTSSHEGMFIHFFYRRHTNRNKKKEQHEKMKLQNEEKKLCSDKHLKYLD